MLFVALLSSNDQLIRSIALLLDLIVSNGVLGFCVERLKPTRGSLNIITFRTCMHVCIYIVVWC